jgi:hypothetical protein
MHTPKASSLLRRWYFTAKNATRRHPFLVFTLIAFMMVYVNIWIFNEFTYSMGFGEQPNPLTLISNQIAKQTLSSCSREKSLKYLCKIEMVMSEEKMVEIHPPSIPDKSVVVGVLSAASYVERRQIIRDIWQEDRGDWFGLFIIGNVSYTHPELADAIEVLQLLYFILFFFTCSSLFSIV